jgi:hypothetical protein
LVHRPWPSLFLFSLSALVSSVAPAARAASSNSVVRQWNATALQAIRDTHPGPPLCARALAIVSTCMYDAWTASDATAAGARLGGALRRPATERTPANKQQAIRFAAYRALVDLFPQPGQAPKFTALLQQLGYDPAGASTDLTTPSGSGSGAAPPADCGRGRGETGRPGKGNR